MAVLFGAKRNYIQANRTFWAAAFKETPIEPRYPKAGNVHDSHELPNLLHGAETRLYGDSACRGARPREQLKQLAKSKPRFQGPAPE
jgi:IS5 family transposase